MTDAEKLEQLMNLSGETDTAMLTIFLQQAAAAIINRAYPFGTGEESVPEKYEQLQVRLAYYYFLRQGAAGEIVHLENGISRHWEDGDAPATLLREITPMGGAL